MCLHKLPHLAQPTLNDLQPRQHEKVSLVCVRAQSPPGLALIPCALSAVDTSWPKKRLNQTHACRENSKQGTLRSYDPF